MVKTIPISMGLNMITSSCKILLARQKTLKHFLLPTTCHAGHPAPPQNKRQRNNDDETSLFSSECQTFLAVHHFLQYTLQCHQLHGLLENSPAILR